MIKVMKKMYKFTLYAEICPICKDDVVCLDPKLAASLGGVSPLLLCYRVTANIHLIDPITLKLVEVSGGSYWHKPIPVLLSSKQLIEFVVLDVETPEQDYSLKETLGSLDQSDYNNKNVAKYSNKLSIAQVTVAKSSEFGVSNQTHVVVSHLGYLIKPGDLVLGYDLANAVLGESISKPLRGRVLPDILLVRKTYDKKKKTKKRRNWKLKRLKIEADDDMKQKKKSKRY